MAIVIAPPVRIDPGPVTISRCLPDSGPFEIAGALYVILGGQFNPDNFIRVYKSAEVDNPTESDWVEQDSGNAVQAVSFFIPIRVGDTWQVFYQDWTTGNLNHISFDTATDTWGVANDSGVNSPALGFKAAWDGTDFIVIYALITSELFLIRLTSLGVWGSSIAFYDTGSTVPECVGLVMDTSRTYVFLRDSAGAALQYGSINPADTFAGPTSIMAATVRFGQPLLVGGKLYMLVDDRRSGTVTPGAALLWTGTPLAGPVWTAALIQTSAAIVINSITGVSASTTDFTFFYTSSVTKLMYRTLFNGSTFAADAVYYDATANPPAGGMDPANAALYGVGAGLTGTTARVVVQLDFDDFGNETTFYLIAGQVRINRMY